MDEQRIAVIGAGAAGLAAAWSLERAGHEVWIYEKDDVWGGHLKTIELGDGADKMLFDVGTRTIWPRLYPITVAMARHLGVGLIPLPYGYTITLDGKGICGANHQNTPLWREVERECVRFATEMEDLIVLSSVEVVSCSIGEYLDAHGYSDLFKRFILTMGDLLGQEPRPERDTTLFFFAGGVTGGILSLFGPTVSALAFDGGTKALADKLAAPVAERVRLGCGVASVSRVGEQVRVEDERGGVAFFDQAIMAVDGLLALSFLSDPSPLEETLLSSCQLQQYDCLVHADERVLLPGIRDEDRTGIELDERPVMTFNIPAYYRRPRTSPLLITFSEAGIDPALVHRRYAIRTGRDTTYSFEVKKNLHRIQGKNRLWFVGEWTFLASLEHAMASGLVVAEALGSPFPFGNDLRASKLYGVQKALMLNGQESFQLFG